MPRVDTLSDAEAKVIDQVRAVTDEAMRVRQANISGDLRRELEDLYNYVVNTAGDAHNLPTILGEIERRVHRLLW